MRNTDNITQINKSKDSDLSNYLAPFLKNIKETETDENFDINTFLNNSIKNKKNEL